MSSRVTVSLVTYNSAQVIAGCLKAIPPETTVMILDNNSSDNTVAVAKEARPSVIITKTRKNLGFGRAHNYNLRRVKTEFGLVLNPDAYLMPGCFDRMLKTADTYPDAAIIGAQHYDQDGVTPEVSIGNDPYCYIRLERARFNAVHAKKFPDATCCVEYIIGAVMLLRVSAMQVSGFFDPKIFMYHEDAEICARARMAGFSVLLEPLAKAIHLSGKSCGNSCFVARLKQYYHSKCKLQVYAKYHGIGAKFFAFSAKEFLMQLRRLFKAVIKGNRLNIHKHAAGIWGVGSGINQIVFKGR